MHQSTTDITINQSLQVHVGTTAITTNEIKVCKILDEAPSLSMTYVT